MPKSRLQNLKGSDPFSKKGVRPHLGIVFLLLVAAAGALFFPRAGRFLVVEDRFAQADLGLVLSGEEIGRSLAARDLYRQGRIQQILVIPEFEIPPHPELVKLGLVKPGPPPAPWPERILIASGVPREKIFFLQPVEGTINEALQVRRYLKEKGFFDGESPVRLVLVTSKYASRRARFIFRWILRGEKVKILSCPTPYDSFQPDRWWRKPRVALSVVTEYQKLVWNWLTLLLRFY